MNMKKKTKTIITEENFRNYARTQGWFDTALYENVVFTIKKDKTPSNMLSVIRKVFKSNYVGKDSYKDSWKYTIYCGDKETMKDWNTPINGLGPINKNKFVKDCVNDLRKSLNM